MFVILDDPNIIVHEQSITRTSTCQILFSYMIEIIIVQFNCRFTVVSNNFGDQEISSHHLLRRNILRVIVLRQCSSPKISLFK